MVLSRLITHFDPAAIETIILHELAHIKRHDYLMNILQSLVEIILFFHPFIWWLTKEVRQSREHCCDDLVLELGTNRTVYVQALTALQWQKPGEKLNTFTLSANGQNTGFSMQVKRMFKTKETGISLKQLIMFFGGLLAFFFIFSNGYIKKSEIIDQPKQGKIRNFDTQPFKLKLKTELISSLTEIGKLLELEIASSQLINPIDSANIWIYWGNQKIRCNAVIIPNKGKILLMPSNIEVQKKDWNENFDKPFTFKINGKWYKTENIEAIIQVPKKKNPVAVNTEYTYHKQLQNKESRLYQLLTKGDVADYYYFEKIGIATGFTFGLAIKIVEDL